jgi:hypothetical protein
MPVALRNTEAARRLTANIGETDVDPAIEQSTPAGDAARLKASRMFAGFSEQFASIGVQLGARYDGSPVIGEGGSPPADSLTSYVPTSAPGGRAPHVWLDAGRGLGSSLFDRLGRGFTLLRLGPRSPDVSGIVETALIRQMRLDVLDIADSDTRDLYGCDLALIRPDQYVAWRGNGAMKDAEAVLAQVCGHRA